MKEFETLTKLVYACGPTGFEGEVQEVFSNLISPLVDKTYKDNLGNFYAEIIGHENMPRIMINSHCDSIGFMIKYIGERGFIYTDDIPGHVTTDYRMLPGTRVLIKSRNSGRLINGHFVPSYPIHNLADEELELSDERQDLAIDIGATTQMNAMKHVSVGDYVILEPSLIKTSLGNKIVGTNLDDRLGLYCLYRIAQNLKRRPKNMPTIIFISTVCEESFIGAAACAAKTAKADLALTIDVTIATDQIVTDADYAVSKRFGTICLNEGVSLARGRAVSDDMFMELEKMCKGKTPIKYQVEVGGGNAESEQIQPSGYGVKTALLSIPCRNAHTTIETVSIEDTETLVKLATMFCKKLPQKFYK